LSLLFPALICLERRQLAVQIERRRNPLESLSTPQMIGWIVALLVGGALTAWGTILTTRYMLADFTDPLTKQGGLSPAQDVDKKK